jgi:hypothetical protein
MEIIGDIHECQGSRLTSAGFEGIEKFYGSLIVCENLYVFWRSYYIGISESIAVWL